MSLFADIFAAAADARHLNPAPASAPGRFTVTAAIAFVQQAEALGQGDLARDLVAQNEAGLVTSDEARARLMAAVHSGGARVPGGGGHAVAPNIDSAAIYAARAESIRAPLDPGMRPSAGSVGLLSTQPDPGVNADPGEIYARRRTAIHASARDVHRNI